MSKMEANRDEEKCRPFLIITRGPCSFRVAIKDDLSIYEIHLKFSTNIYIKTRMFIEIFEAQREQHFNYQHYN